MTSSPKLEGGSAFEAILPASNAQLTSIVCAYVSNNSVTIADLPKLIAQVRESLSPAPPSPKDGIQKPTASEIKKSITHTAIISFEDGKPYKTMRRHLTLRGLTPEDYRAKWGLPATYPMTAQAYSEQRSELARSLGLGQQRRKNRPAQA